MAFLLMRIPLGLYILITIFLILRLLANLMFDKTCRNYNYSGRMLKMILLWPFSIFSAQGRKKLTDALLNK